MKIKATLAIIICIFLFSSIHAQDSAKTHKVHHDVMPKFPRDGYLAILAGIGSPTEDYATGGAATAGRNFSVSAAFPGIISHCGLAFKFDYGTNSRNKNVMLEILQNNNDFGNINYSLPSSLGHISYKTFLTGLYLTYPHKHFTFDTRILIGALIATLPAETVGITDVSSGNNGTIYQAETSGAGFAIDLGVEARFPVPVWDNRLTAMFSIDYLHAPPTFNTVESGMTANPTGSIVQGYGSERTITQPFDLFNLSFGIGYIISAQKPAVPKLN